MFNEASCEATRGEKLRRAKASVFSISLQIVAVGILVITPLFLYPSISSSRFTPVFLAALPATDVTAAPAVPRSGRASVMPFLVKAAGHLSLSSTPGALDTGSSEPPALDPGSSQPGQGGEITSLLGSSAPKEVVLAQPKPKPGTLLRISKMMEGNLLFRVQPEYPSLAKQARVQGRVELTAVINRDGKIENLRVVSGPALLAPAAVDAVRQWRYRPYVLNGEPIEVETTIVVNFTL